ncbi:hypothetical protein N7449_002968 [Penicillium cf. viridicatum]|uniref:Uncharacterized protein n=1 Tax=Penicillium cf. viridicatum TaxID=2972119 RepID=A0A9W9MW22_9EURO|nr:hypothetical protein N7449_002968 [Penicillium cf. viridicatum]
MDRFLQDPESEKLLSEHNRALEAAEAVKGMQYKPKVTRHELLKQFKYRQKMNKDQPRGRASASTVDVSFAPPIYPPCLAPLDGLKKVMFKDLLLETHHRGSYILKTKIKMIPLQMLNEKLRCHDGSVDKGQILLVKEPYLTLTSVGEYGVRVDHVSDNLFIPLFDKMVPPAWRERLPEDETSQWMAGDWLRMGNDYSKGLECSPTEEEMHYLLYYRGLAFFQVDEWDAALRDLDAVPAGPESDKALRGKAQTLHHLRRFRESCDVFTKLCKKHPEDVGAKNDFREAIGRLVEQKKGGYNFKMMQEKASKTYPPLLDHATWIGPVTVRQTKSQGRGLFTTEAVKVGGLLLCEKAFAYATEYPSRPRWDSNLHVSTETGTTIRGGQLALASSIIEKLDKNPSSASAITESPTHSLPSFILLLQAVRNPSNQSKRLPQPKTQYLLQRVRIGLSQTLNENLSALATFIFQCHSNLLALSGPCPENAGLGRPDVGAHGTAALEAPVSEIHGWFSGAGSRYQIVSSVFAGISVATRMIIMSPMKARWPDAAVVQPFGAPACVERVVDVVSSRRRWAAETVEEDYAGDLKSADLLESAAVDAAVGFVIEGSVEGPLVVKKWGLAMDNLVIAWMILGKSLLKVAPERAMQAERYARMAYLISVREEASFDVTYGMSLKVAHEPRSEESQVEGWVV